MPRPSILFYCQHLLGLGHATRAARLVRALQGTGERVLFVTGGRPVPGLDLGGARVLPLPPLLATDPAAARLVRPDGRPPGRAYLGARRRRLLEALATHDPAVVLVELFPFGRHALAGELAPLLLGVADDRRTRGPAAPRVVVSLRDVLVSKRNQAWFELAVTAVTLAWVDRVLVHGSPDLIPLARTFGLADRLGDRLIYTGYLADPPVTAAHPGPGRRDGEVVVSGGGGQVAGPLFRTALAARPLAANAQQRRWRLVTGPYLPADERAAIERLAAGPGHAASDAPVVVERFRDDFPALLGRAALSVSQAGYNTVLDVLASRVRAVVVPFEGSGDEQAIRASLLAARGALLALSERDLTPERLAAAMERALARRDFPAPAALDLDGARRSVVCLAALVDEVARARRDRVSSPGAGRRRTDARSGPGPSPRPAGTASRSRGRRGGR